MEMTPVGASATAECLASAPQAAAADRKMCNLTGYASGIRGRGDGEAGSAMNRLAIAADRQVLFSRPRLKPAGTPPDDEIGYA